MEYKAVPEGGILGAKLTFTATDYWEAHLFVSAEINLQYEPV